MSLLRELFRIDADRRAARSVPPQLETETISLPAGDEAEEKTAIYPPPA